jgi:serine/threonine protein kinase
MEFIIESTYAKIYKIPYPTADNVHQFACLKKIKKEKHYAALANEIAILKHFDHPNIIKVLDDSNVHKGEAILELAETDLFEYTKNEGYAKISFLDVVYPQMTAAIEEVHRKGFIHIDIKLENFLVFPNNVIKLCDFGLAQKITDPAPSVMRGTVTYVSPEMILLRKITTKHDYWALAVSIYILITCNDPWPGKNVYEIMDNIIDGNYYDFPREIKNDPSYKPYIDFIKGTCRGHAVP